VTADGFTIWVTGPDPRALEACADGIAAQLAARRLPVETLDARTPGIDTLAGEGMDRRLAVVAGLLARHGVATVIALPASRAARDAARATLGRMIEVHVLGLGPVPAGHQAPERAEVEIAASEGAALDRVLHTLEVLGLVAPGEQSAYSEEEERAVIRRLKGFGYL